MPFISIQSAVRRSIAIACGRAPMDPFPFEEYFINGEPLVDPYDQTYYNDPLLDGVQLNVRLGGDPAAWGSTEYDVYYTTGLLQAPSVFGISVGGGVYYPSVGEVDLWRYTAGAFVVDHPQSNKYVDSSQTNPGPQTIRTDVFPGVASTDPWGSGGGELSYIQVPCYGRPISYENWYSENLAKTNDAVTFSGYTSYGDMNGYEFPDFRYQTDFNPQMTPGYVRRYVAGIVDVNADLATLTTADIIFGALFVGTPSGGTIYICANGVVQKTQTVAFKPDVVYASCDMAWGNWPYAATSGLPQGYDYFEMGVRDFDRTENVFEGLYFGADPLVPLDTYDVKWAWYYDFVPDAGEGTFCGLLTSRAPNAYTHPGWPCDYIPPEPSGFKYFETAIWTPSAGAVYSHENMTMSSDGLTMFVRMRMDNNDYIIEVYRDVAGVWTYQDTITDPATDLGYPGYYYNDITGMRCSANGNYLVVTDYNLNGNIGGARVYFYDGVTWGFQANLIGDISIPYVQVYKDPGVSISADGTTIAVAADYTSRNHNEYDDTPTETTPVLVIYKRTGTVWNFDQVVSPFSMDFVDVWEWGDITRDIGAFDLSGDGNVIAIGSHIRYMNYDITSERRECRIFENVNGTYIFRDATLPVSYPTAYGLQYVSISHDGSRLVVGTSDQYLPDNAKAEWWGTLGYAHLYERTGNRWEPTVILKPVGEVFHGTSYGAVISGDGNTIAMGTWTTPQVQIRPTGGYVYINSNGGDVAIFKRQAKDRWEQTQVFNPAADIYDFGRWFHISYDGTRIGVVSEDSTIHDTLTDYGNAHIWDLLPYQKPTFTDYWSEANQIYRPNSMDYAYFGTQVRLSGDGNTLVAANDDLSSSIHVYVRDGVSWDLQTILVDPNSGSVAYEPIGISNDGNVVSISTLSDNIVIFERTGTVWDAGTTIPLAGLSACVVSGDGTKLFIASGANTLVYMKVLGTWTQVGTIPISGVYATTSTDGKVFVSSVGGVTMRVYIYEDTSLTGDGTAWTLTATFVNLTGSNGNTSRFGWGVAIVSADGNTVAMSDPVKAFNQGNNIIYIAERLGTDWFVRDIIAPDVAMGTLNADWGGQRDGWSITEDGETIFVGCRTASGDDTPEAGAIYVYRKLPVSPGNPNIKEWFLVDKVVSTYPDTTPGHGFANSISASLDGNTIVVGASNANVPDIYGPPLVTETITLTAKTFGSFTFEKIKDAGVLPAGSILYSVSIDVILDASANYTYSNDLALWVGLTGPPVSSGNGVFQIGGATGAAPDWWSWNNGGSEVPGTTTLDAQVVLSSGIDLSGYEIWFGNGYEYDDPMDPPPTSGTWTGTLTFKYLIP